MEAKRAALLVLSMFAAACGSLEDTQYRGEPLAVLSGQVTSADLVVPQNGVRLALGWYPGMSNNGGATDVVTQDVVYEGDFPLTYKFGVYSPPPREAIASLGDTGPVKAAFGLLLAYEDRNGNDRLDTIPADGAPIDKVLGVSSRFNANSYFILYVEEGAGPEGDPVWQDLEPGFNLVHLGESAASVVPLDTAVPIALTRDPSLDILVCEVAWEDRTGTDQVCGIELTQPVPHDVSGTLSIDEDAHELQVSVTKDGVELSAVTLTLDGVAVPNGGSGHFYLRDETRTLFTPGATHTVIVTLPGEAPSVNLVTIPGDFQITTPAANAVLPVGQALSATWTASAGVERYLVMLSGGIDFDSFSQSVGGTTFVSDQPVNSAGAATLTVSARSGVWEPIIGSLSRSVPVSFAP